MSKGRVSFSSGPPIRRDVSPPRIPSNAKSIPQTTVLPPFVSPIHGVAPSPSIINGVKPLIQLSPRPSTPSSPQAPPQFSSEDTIPQSSSTYHTPSLMLTPVEPTQQTTFVPPYQSSSVNMSTSYPARSAPRESLVSKTVPIGSPEPVSPTTSMVAAVNASGSPSSYSAYRSNPSSDVNKTLFQLGFTQVGSVCSKGSCRYLIAVTSKGDRVLIDVSNSQGVVSVKEGEADYTQTDMVSVIPHSVRMGANECREFDVCGMAFECSEGICTVKGQGSDTNEESFTVTNVNGTNLAHKKTSLVAFPIVDYNDIIGFHSKSIESIHKTSMKVRENSWNTMVKVLDELNETTDKLFRQSAVMRRSSFQLYNSIYDSTNILRYHYETYLKNPENDEDEKNKNSMVKAGLNKRTQMFESLVSITTKIRTFQKEVNNIFEMEEEIIRTLKTLNKGLATNL
jgi:hypothetical protein